MSDEKKKEPKPEPIKIEITCPADWEKVKAILASQECEASRSHESGTGSCAPQQEKEEKREDGTANTQ